MPQPYQADETANVAPGPSKEMAWRAFPSGEFYAHEDQRRRRKVYVFAQSHHLALREASRELHLAPEHITLGKPKDTYRVYVLECTTKTARRVTVHVGIAKDVGKRVAQHRKGEVKATRGREIIWLGNSERMTHADALRREIQLKSLRPAQKKEWAAEQKERK